MDQGYFRHMSYLETEIILGNLCNRKAMGFDGTPSKVYKYALANLVVILSIVIHSCFVLHF